MDLINKKSIFLDFNNNYCSSSIELLNSEIFFKILKSFIHQEKIKRPLWWEEYEQSGCFKNNNDDIVANLVNILKLLTVFEVDEICDDLLIRKDLLEMLVEELYNYWRHFERYAFIINNGHKKGIEKLSFMNADNAFSNIVLNTYRHISEKLQGYPNRVYRQISAGSNASFMLQSGGDVFSGKYEKLNNIKVIHTIIMHSPFIVYPSNTIRKGVFKELEYNPFEKINLLKKDWFCFPLLIGEHRARVFFHKDYVNLGLSLANLFEIDTNLNNQQIDLVLLYGVDNTIIQESSYFLDLDNKLFIGYVPYGEEATYFGYMKKMLLTLHNLANIRKNELPIHGAMFSILFKNRAQKNIIIIGDSGTGKSETLEALRSIGDKDIIDITIVFDDMGSLKINNNKVYGYGSETGAFVRLDDLEPGYAYRSIDRSILMNPDQKNARAIIPISRYNDIIKGYKVDVVLYANNYLEQEGIYKFVDKESAIKVFKKGERMAKSTTSEKGIVETYFANPFGPLQEKKRVDRLLEIYFSMFFLSNIYVGEIYTCLGVDGKEQIGPKKSALELLKLLKTL